MKWFNTHSIHLVTVPGKLLAESTSKLSKHFHSLIRIGPRLPSYYFESTPDFSEDFLQQIADGTFVGKLIGYF